MKKALFFLILLLIFSCSGNKLTEQNYPKTVTIRISGSETISYRGSIGNSTSATDVDGTITESSFAQYSRKLEDENDEIFAHFFKEQEAGTLTVQIGLLLMDNSLDIKKEGSTSASFGSLYLNWKP